MILFLTRDNNSQHPSYKKIIETNTIQTCNSTEKLLSLIKTKSWSLIIIDAELLDLNNLKEIKSLIKTFSIPSLVISEFRDIKLVKAIALDLNPTQFLEKTTSAIKLQETISELVSAAPNKDVLEYSPYETVLMHKENIFIEAILETIPGIFMALDQNLGTIKCNNNFLKLIGIEAQSLSSFSIKDNIAKEDRDKFNQLIDQTLNLGFGEATIKILNGSLKEVSYYLSYQKIEINKQNLIIGAGVDVSKLENIQIDLQKGQQELQYQKELNHAILDSFQGIIYAFDAKGNFEKWNQSYLDLLGINENEVHKINPLDPIHPDDKERIAQHIEDIFKGESVRTEGKILDASNTAHDYYFFAQKYEIGNKTLAVGNAFDVSEIKNTQKALIASETRFNEISNQLPVAVFELNKLGAFTYLNNHGLKLLNLSSEDLKKGLNKKDIFRPQDQHLFEENNRTKLLPSTLSSKETEVFDSYGNVIPTIINLSPIIENKQFVGTRGILLDISEKRKAEFELKDRERRIKLAAKSAKIGLWDYYIESGKILVNKTWVTQLKYPENILVTPDSDWSELKNNLKFRNSIIHPDDLPEVNKLLNLHLNGTNDNYRTEFRILMGDGNWKWILEAGKISDYNKQGKPIRVSGIQTDIDNIKQAHEIIYKKGKEFSTLIKNLPGIVLRFSSRPPYQILFISEQVKTILGFDKTDFMGDVGATSYWNLIYKDDLTQLEKRIGEAIEQKTPIDLRFRMYNSNRELLWMSGKAQAVFNSKGKVEYIVSNLNDISQKVKEDEERRKMSIAVEQSPLSIVITNPDGYIEYANQQFTKNTGYHTDEVIGKNPRLLNSKAHNRAFFTDMWTTISSGKKWDGEVCNKRKNGELFWESMLITPLLDNSGKITHYVSLKADITEIKKNREELAMLNQLVNVALETASVGTFWVDFNMGNKWHAKDSTASLLGMKLNQEGIYDIDYWQSELLHFAKENPEYKKTINTSIQKYTESIKGLSDSFETEYPIRSANKQLRWINIRAKVTKRYKNGKAQIMVGTVIDISHHIESERIIYENQIRLKNIIETNPGVSYREKSNKPGQMDYISPEIEKLTGYSLEDIQDKNLINYRDLIHEDDRQAVNASIRNALKQKKPFNAEYRIRDKNKHIKWVFEKGNPEINAAGKVDFFDGSLLDITPRVTMEKELSLAKDQAEKEANKSALLLNSVGNGVIGIDKKGRVVFINDAACRMLKFKPDEIIGENLHHLMHHSYANGEAYPIEECPNHKAALAGKAVRITDEVFWTKDKKAFPVDYQTTPIINKGTIDGVVISFQDITEQVNLYANLVSLLNNSKDFIFFKDTDLNFTAASQSMAKTLGAGSWEEMVGKTDSHFIHKEFADEFEKEEREIISGQKTSLDKITPFIDQKGNQKWIATQKFALKDRHQQIIGLFSLGRDITKQKNDEIQIKKTLKELYQFQNAMDFISSHVYIKNRGLKYTYANKKMLELLNVNQQEVFGTTDSDYFAPEINKVTDEIDKKVLGGEQTVREISLTKKDGKKIILLETKTPIYQKGKTKEIVGLIGIATDITELKDAKQKAEEAIRLKGEFLANMSHEIRTPLNAIIGFSDLLNKTISKPQEMSYVKSIKASGKSLLSLLNDILDLSKIESGILDINRVYFDFKALLKEMSTIYKEQAKEKGLDFYLLVDPSVPTYLYTDEIRLRQVLVNLLSNAIKFTNQGYVKLKVNALNFNTEKSCDIVIEVEDTGIGISDKFIKNIFSSFTQADGKATKKAGGTGLGLALSENITKLLNGNINLKSKLDKGSTFRVHLKHVKYNEDEDLSSHADVEFDPTQIKFNKASILVVDDSQLNRTYIKGILNHYQLEVFEATQGFEALAILNQQAIDLVITDLEMPIMNGFELYDKIKNSSDYADIPVIASSSSSMDLGEDRGIIHNFADYLSKPVPIKVLIATLIKFLPYQMVAEIDTNKEDTNKVLNIENKEAFQKDFLDLKNSYEPLKKQQAMDEVESFAEKCIKSGEQYGITDMVILGKAINTAVQSFDIELMLKLLKQFEQLKDKLEESTSN